MTKSLEKVFARASKLPAEEQDALAAWLAKELESEELDEDRSALRASQPTWQAALKGGAGSRRRRRTDLTEERWGRLFTCSQDKLGRLADEALEEHAAGGSMVRDGG